MLVVDFKSKLQAAECKVVNVRHVVCLPDSVTVLQGDDTLLTIRELPLTRKLEVRGHSNSLGDGRFA